MKTAQKSQNLCKSKCIFAVEAKLVIICVCLCRTLVHMSVKLFFKVRKLWRVYGVTSNVVWWNITLEWQWICFGWKWESSVYYMVKQQASKQETHNNSWTQLELLLGCMPCIRSRRCMQKSMHLQFFFIYGKRAFWIVVVDQTGSCS